ncbi:MULTISPECIES: SDR family oxidoreductase [unclassified Pseudovibrio]|uniref:SDR family oxidoreductase n=1 Tax=unclassified Pseudovibrio TaxID=2627060 RepID=UPI0007AE9478|nr:MULTISPECIES: SDR family oxidoreductase [unclassified Pseudovibrio]KZL02408.1 NAD(P)H azoreductase [Pseudovibrio sp. W74]KZL08048.1 NAD(P)H azoreductase [Pseudovibrio sp. Ad14]
MNKRILVTGANGTIGLHLLRELKQTPWHVRALVRSTENSRLVSSMGAEAVRGDFSDLPSLFEAMAGIDTLVLITSATPQAAQQASAVLHAALESGVRKVVRISAIKADATGPTANTVLHAATEDELVRSGMEYVILRPNLFMQNMFLATQTIAEHSSFFFGMGDARMGMVDTRDVAECAVECVLSDHFNGDIFEVTGAKSLSYFDVASALSEELKRTITYVPVMPQDVYDGIVGAGWDEWIAGISRDYAQAYRSGWGDFTTDAVSTICGRPPRSIKTFIRQVFCAKAALSVSIGPP